MNDKINKAFRATVRGMVQGVGFRYFVERVANQIGVKGYVRNVPDGTVEVVASGSDEQLRELVDRIKEGPSVAHVTGVDLRWLDGAFEFKSFGIRF
ncbi:MAG: acylphosphatase [bacterium]